jgi:hypothetical protein
MAVTVTQSKGNTDASSSATSLAATFDLSVSAGAKLIAFFNLYAAGVTVSSVTSTGATWTKVTSRTIGAQWTTEVWESTRGHSGGGSYQVTGNLSGGAYVSIAILELGNALDVADFNSAEASSNGSSVAGAAITPTVDGLHLASMGSDAVGPTISPGTGWSEVIEVDEANNAGTIAVESRTAANGVQQTPTWNINASATCNILHIVVEDAGGGGPTGNPWYYYAQL